MAKVNKVKKVKSLAAEAYFFCCDIACMLLAGKSGNRCQRVVTLLYRSGCAVMARWHMDGHWGIVNCSHRHIK